LPTPSADAVCNYIIENITGSLLLEEEDDSPNTTIKFYVAEGQDADYEAPLLNYLKELTKLELPEVPELTTRRIKNAMWEEEYRKSIKPSYIGEDIVIRPTWTALSDRPKYEIIIEPKMAFGTGTHETTQGCLELIREHFQPGSSFLDVGCGSGILSMLADKLGATFIKAIDYDQVSIENCLENFELNSVTAKYEIACGSAEKFCNDSPYDLVCANIIKTTILEMLPDLVAVTTKDGSLVLSGLLEADQKDIEAALAAEGMTYINVTRKGEWLSIITSRVAR